MTPRTPQKEFCNFATDSKSNFIGNLCLQCPTTFYIEAIVVYWSSQPLPFRKTNSSGARFTYNTILPRAEAGNARANRYASANTEANDTCMYGSFFKREARMKILSCRLHSHSFITDKDKHTSIVSSQKRIVGKTTGYCSEEYY